MRAVAYVLAILLACTVSACGVTTQKEPYSVTAARHAAQNKAETEAAFAKIEANMQRIARETIPNYDKRKAAGEFHCNALCRAEVEYYSAKHDYTMWKIRNGY